MQQHPLFVIAHQHVGLLCLTLWMCFLGGCASLPKPSRKGTIPRVIWDIEFRGNRALTASQLNQALETSATPATVRWGRLKLSGSYALYQKAVIRNDIKRLHQLYRYQGFYRSQIREHPSSPVVFAEDKAYRPYKRVSVIFLIEEGPRAELLRNALIEWKITTLPDEFLATLFPKAPFAGKPLSALPKAQKQHAIQKFKQKILRKLPIHVGQYFSTPRYQEIKKTISQRLREQSFALSTVLGKVEIEKSAQFPPRMPSRDAKT
ncbi:MAG: POTRA domain-containing protein, partial [Myxococcota bacterium]